MEKKTYTCEREIPELYDLIHSVEQYRCLLSFIAEKLEEDIGLMKMQQKDPIELYEYTRGLNRIVTDLGYLIEDMFAFEEQEDAKERKIKQEELKESEEE